MKVDIDVDVVDEVVDAVVVSWIKDNLRMIKNIDGCLHKDDQKYNKKLVKALNLLLDYIGEDDESN